MRTQLQQPESARRDPSAGPAPGRAHVVPDREASPIGHLQRTIGNQAVGRLLRANAEVAGVGSALVMASGDSAEELQAGAAGERARHAPAPAAPLTANDSTGATTTLSDSGRRYFEPLVGAALGGARVHVDGRADRLTRLAGARALAYADDVFIAPDRFVPESIEGRALLGHELAHVAQARTGRPQVFRQPAVEPHYPTEDEQREITRLLSREFEGTSAAPPPAPGAPAPKRAVALDADKRRLLADDLRRPYLATLDRLDREGGSSGTDLDEADALEVVTQAREDIYKTFGAYARQITLTRDEATTPAARRAANQVLVTFRIADATVRALGRTIATTHCPECLTRLAPLDDDSRVAVIDALIDFGLQEEGGKKMRRVTNRRVPGAYNHGERRISLRLRPREELTHTAVHELMHALAHPVFRAAFGDEDNVNEGFTEYLSRKVFTGKTTSYQSEYEKIGAVRDALKGPFPFMGGDEAEESLRLAYFRGRLDLIGWQASGPEEEKEVKEAAKEAAGSGKPEEPKQWDAATARRWAEIYEARARARQAPSRNVLGVGLYLTKGSGDATIAVRYARVLARTEPYAKGQLLLEGRLLGSPSPTLGTLGASLGIAGEYQHPYFYAGGGVRFVGTGVPGAGTTRLDVSPFAGVGFRLWQTIRVGAEGFVAIPVKEGEGLPWGGAINVGVEF